MLVIGHRGASQEALENSWQAFELCVAMGADRIELDLRLSLDNKVFILHNPSIGKLANKRLWLSKTPATVISRIKLQNNEKIPRLEPLLAHFLPRIELNLELKGGNTRLAQRTAALLGSHQLRHKTIISSFNSRQLAVFHRLCPEVRAALLWSNDQKLTRNPLALIKKLGLGIFHPEFKALNPTLMAKAKKMGLEVYPWISLKDEIEQPEHIWEALLAYGVDGFCTNFPREMIKWQKKRPR